MRAVVHRVELVHADAAEREQAEREHEPPSITRNRATAIAGTAASSRALRSERCLRGTGLLCLRAGRSSSAEAPAAL